MKNARRVFLKKIVYVAPAVVSLGMLVEPIDLEAARFNSGNDNEKHDVHDNRDKSKMVRKTGKKR